MRHQKRVAKLGRTASHRKALMMNLAKSLITHGKIKTTDAKAKELRRVVERLITYGKRGTVHHRRLAYKVLNDRSAVKQLFDHIAPQYADRNGGYTRITKLGFRDNDSASVSLIEFVDYRQPGEKKSKKTTTEKKKSTDNTKTKSVKETKAKEKTTKSAKQDKTKSEEKSAEEKTVSEKKNAEPAETETEKSQEIEENPEKNITD